MQRRQISVIMTVVLAAALLLVMQSSVQEDPMNQTATAIVEEATAMELTRNVPIPAIATVVPMFLTATYIVGEATGRSLTLTASTPGPTSTLTLSRTEPPYRMTARAVQNQSLLITATALVGQATAIQATRNAAAIDESDVNLTPFSGLPMTIWTISAEQQATNDAIRTAVPGARPFDYGHILNATQFALDRAANPVLTATIEGCYAPGQQIIRRDIELTQELNDQLDFVKGPFNVVVYRYDFTQDCVSYAPQPTMLHIDLNIPFDDGGIDLNESVTRLASVLSAYPEQVTGIENMYIQIRLANVETADFAYTLTIYMSYGDFLENYANGLRGVSLLVPGT